MTMFFVLESACSKIPCPVFSIAHIIVLLIKWAVPVVLIILGMLDFAKAAMAHDESDISKAKQTFIRRLISAMCVFFVMAALELTFNVLAASARGVDGAQDGSSVWSCVQKIFNGDKDGCWDDPFKNPDDATDGNADNNTNNTNNN